MQNIKPVVDSEEIFPSSANAPAAAIPYIIVYIYIGIAAVVGAG